MLIKDQPDAAVYIHLFSVKLLNMFRVSRTHHQEYQKLYLLPLVFVTSPDQATEPAEWRVPVVANTVFDTPDDGCVTPETCRVV
jgi:hypothetical protein